MREPNGRSDSDIRPLSIETDVNRYAEGSALIKAGHTHVLCTASVEEKVPGWMEGKGTGWVTAEYSMLPRSTHTRSRRDREKVSGRTLEIQRLIGRSLRTITDLSLIGERSIHIDCDVLQADGGTRTAAITGSFVALATALRKMEKEGKVSGPCWIDTVSAISIGMKEKRILTDLDYSEDSTCDVDMNFVITGSGKFIEIQGTAEKQPFSDEDLTSMKEAAKRATSQIQEIQKSALKKRGIDIPK